MWTKTVVVQRTIVDHVRSVGRVANVQVDKDFLKFARGTRFRYQYHNYSTLTQKKSRGNHCKRENRVWLKKKKWFKGKKIPSNQYSTLAWIFWQLLVQAKKELKMELRTNLNAFRKSAQDKEAEVLQLDKQIKRKTEELKQ